MVSERRWSGKFLITDVLVIFLVNEKSLAKDIAENRDACPSRVDILHLPTSELGDGPLDAATMSQPFLLFGQQFDLFGDTSLVTKRLKVHSHWMWGAVSTWRGVGGLNPNCLNWIS